MTARAIPHRYSSGREFFTVQCNDCLAVLNSGHHYTAEYRHHADRLAADHNEAVHRLFRAEYTVKVLVPEPAERVTVFTEADAVEVALNMLSLPRVETVMIEASPRPYRDGVFALRYVHRGNGAGGESMTRWSCWAPNSPVVHCCTLDAWLDHIAGGCPEPQGGDEAAVGRYHEPHGLRYDTHQHQIAASSPVTEQLAEEVAGSAPGDLPALSLIGARS